MTARKKNPAETAAEQMASQMAEYQKIMGESMAQYEALVAKANSDLEKLVMAASPAPPIEKPEAQWTESNGHELLVLNKAAAVFFSAIFEQVGVLAAELGKVTKK
jgi:succinylglutamate desuccinylase